MTTKAFSLDELIYPIWHWWLLAWGLGVLNALSVLGLLMTSGWFITMSAWAGLVAVATHSFNYLAPSALIRTFAVTRTAARYGDLVVSHQAIFELLKQLRSRFFYEFAKLSNHQRAFLGSAQAQHRLVRDIDTLDEFVLRFVSPWVVATVSLLVFAVLLALKIKVWLAFLLGVPLLIVAGLMVFLVDKINTKNLLIEQRKTTFLNSLPAITQLLIWQQWHTHSYHRDVAKKLTAMEKTERGVKQIGLVVVQWSILLTMLLALVLGALQVADGQLSVAWLLALVLGFFALIELVVPILAEPSAYARSIYAKNQLNQLLAKKTISQSQSAPECFDLVVQHLSIKQPNAVFGVSDINFVAKYGVPLVISGVSGGGKSTLLDALSGQIVPVAGLLKLHSDDGKVIDWQSVDWQQSGVGKLGFLGQKVDIFDQSLADNLRLGKQNASDDELWQVLAWVDLADWVKAQPQGLNTALGEYGMAVSGGQARRIALARLLLSPKKVLLLDEPFAGLDKQSRNHIWQILKNKQKNGLLIVVSHHQDIIDDDDVDNLVIGQPSVVQKPQS